MEKEQETIVLSLFSPGFLTPVTEQTTFRTENNEMAS